MTSSTGTSRVVALVDMDCFYVQVEERDDPSIKGKPAVVVQYKAYKGGGIIAVNYEARAKGVSRNMRGDDAKALCPEIALVRVPETRGKADLTKYRNAGQDVIQVLTKFSSCVERASIDEAYIDLSAEVEKRLSSFLSEDKHASGEIGIVNSLAMEHLEANFVLGHSTTESWLEMIRGSEIAPLEDIKLAIGAEIVGKMREAVYQETGFRCSAGIAHNKILAKLCCGLNKPNKQTVLPHASVPQLWSSTKIKKVRNLGGKLGDFLVEKMKLEIMGDLLHLSEKELGTHLGSKTGLWLYQLARGFDDEPVNPRQLPKSIGCNKNFYGPESLTTKDKVKFWIHQLAAEVVERVQKDYEVNNRRAKTLTLYVTFEHNSLSRSCRFHPQYNLERIATEAYGMMEKLYQNLGLIPVHSLGLVASKFDVSGYAKIDSFFTDGKDTDKATSSKGISTVVTESVEVMPSSSKVSDIRVNIVKSTAPSTSKTSTGIKNSETAPSVTENIDTSTASNSTVHIRKAFFKFSEPSKEKIPTGPTEPKIPPMAQKCERCAKLVPMWDYVSHMDNHVARDLSREINGLPPLGFDLRPETVDAQERAREKASATSPGKKVGSRGSKRPRGAGRNASTSKRGRVSPTKPLPVKTIDSYFQKK